MTNAMAVMISMFTLIVTILATVLGRGFISIIPILIGVIADISFPSSWASSIFQCSRERMVCRPDLLFAPL